MKPRRLTSGLLNHGLHEAIIVPGTLGQIVVNGRLLSPLRV
jgi:hypothetical protein